MRKINENYETITEAGYHIDEVFSPKMWDENGNRLHEIYATKSVSHGNNSFTTRFTDYFCIPGLEYNFYQECNFMELLKFAEDGSEADKALLQIIYSDSELRLANEIKQLSRISAAPSIDAPRKPSKRL